MYKTIVNNKLEQTYKKRHKALQEFTPREHTQLWFTRRTIENRILLHNLVKHAFYFFPASHSCVVKFFTYFLEGNVLNI